MTPDLSKAYPYVCVWIQLQTLLHALRSHLLTRWEMFSGGNFYPLRTSLEWQMARCRKWRHRQRSSQREIQESWHIGWEMDYTLLDSIWFLREQDDSLARLSRQFCWLTHTFFFSSSFEVVQKEKDREMQGVWTPQTAGCLVLGFLALWFSGLVGVLSLTFPLQWQPGVKILSSRSWNHE